VAARLSGGSVPALDPAARSRLAAAAIVLIGSFIVGAAVEGCGLAASTAGLPATPTVAIPSYSTTIAQTRREIVSALGTANLVLQDATEPFRPPESPSLAAAPRGVFQVVLPQDPGNGYIVVYEFRDVASAAAAGAELAAYIGSGPGRIQFPPDAEHVIRQLNTTLIVYSWSAANSSDPNESKILPILSTVGTEIAVPR
jgi:hypothetical protein